MIAMAAGAILEPDLDDIRRQLVSEGEARRSRPRTAVLFTGQDGPDKLLNDLEAVPHAFLFACLVDRQVPAETAWLVPWRIEERIGSFDFDVLAQLAEDDWVSVMRSPRPAHRLWETMGKILYQAAQRVANSYDGDAASIWNDRPSSARLVARVLEFKGAGPKIGNMVANILVRDFKVELTDNRYIDISADVQVQRVMGRLGFTVPDPKPEVVIYTARDLHPDYPGVFDLALWELGRTVCRPRVPKCSSCRFADRCRYALASA